MARLTTQAPDVQDPRVNPIVGARQQSSNAFSGLSRDLNSLVTSLSSGSGNSASLARLQLAGLKDRAVAESSVGQIDLALDALAQQTDLTPEDISELKDADTFNKKLEQLRLQKPTSTFVQVRRLAELRRNIAQNPIAAPEIISAFGGGGNIDQEIEALLGTVDAQEEVRRQALEQHRLELGPRGQSMTDDQVEYSLQKQIDRTRRAEATQQRREYLDNQFRINNIDEFHGAELTTARVTTAEGNQRLEFLRESRKLLYSQEHQLDVEGAAQELQKAIDTFDPQNPDPQFVETTTFEMRQRINSLRQQYRRALGPGATEAELDKFMYPFEKGLEAWTAYTEGKLGTDAITNAKQRLEDAAAVGVYQKFPQIPPLGVLIDTYQDFFPDDWLASNKLFLSAEPLMAPLLDVIGISAEDADNKTAKNQADNLLDAAGGMAMDRDEALNTLRNYSSFLRRTMGSATVPQEEKANLLNVLRATARSPNNGIFGGFFSGPVDIEAMNLTLPMLANPQVADLIETDPQLSGQILDNFDYYITELSDSILEDTQTLYDAKINVQNIPDILGLRDDVARMGEFLNFQIGGTEESPEILTSIGYDTRVTEEGKVIISPKTGNEFPLRRESALEAFHDPRRVPQYLEDFRQRYQDKISYSAQFLARYTEFSPRDIAIMLLAGVNPLDIRNQPQDQNVQIEVTQPDQLSGRTQETIDLNSIEF